MFALYYNGIYGLILIAITLYFLPSSWARRASLIVSGILLALFVNALSLIPSLLNSNGGLLISNSIHYFPAVDFDIQYRINGLGLLFYSLITGIGCLVFFYAFYYMRFKDTLNAFFAYLTLFAAAMLGIVASNNLILLIIYWELTTITSYLLIGYKHQYERSREAALQGLLTTVIGGLALIAAAAFILISADTLNIHTLLQQPSLLQNSPYLGIITALLILSALTKSAQFPFHYWLPSAMEAPTPVSTYLHSATMVTAGVYLLALFHPILHIVSWWYPTLITVGLATMLTGGWMALRSNDIKMILAYTTVYALGSMIYLLANSKPLALEAMVVFLVVHALYKAALFMLAGFLEVTYETRNIYQMDGLWRISPLASIVLIINCASMASLPPFFGFFAKQLALEAKLSSPDLTLLLEILTFLASGLIALQGFRLIFQILPQRHTQLPKPSKILLAPSTLLTILTISFSLLPYAWNKLRLGHLAAQSITPITHQTTWFSLQNYTSLSTLLSALITVIGFILWLAYNPLIKMARGIQILDKIMPTSLYFRGLLGLAFLGNWVNERFQNGNLQNYLSSLWVFFTFFPLLALFIFPPNTISLSITEHLPLSDIVLACFAVLSALMAVILRKPIMILASLSITGFVMAIIFLIHGAADVAITQVLVDTLIVILFVINLHRLPTLTIDNKLDNKERLTSIILAAVVGGTIGYILFLITQYHLPTNLSQFFLQNSLDEAHGRNVVNVILVDFRAFDTLGEIIVVTAAAIGILGLITKHGESSS